MTTFDESAHPRVATGQFTVKTNDAPTGALEFTSAGPDNTRYTLLVDGRPFTVYDPAVGAIVHQETLPGMPTVAGSNLSLLGAGAPESTGENWVIRAEVLDGAGRVNRAVDVPVPPQGDLLVLSHDSDYFTIDELAERGLSLADCDSHHEEIIELGDAEDEPVELEQVRQWLTESPQDPVSEVTIRVNENDATQADIDVTVYDNLRWNGLFTEDELTEHSDIVDQVYREWFNAEIEVPDSWESVRVTMRTSIDTHRATPLLVLESAWPSYASFRNETDPGTFNARYIGREIRERIDTRLRTAAA